MYIGSGSDTIAAVATPNGTGAIGVIRLSGNKSFEMADKLFRGKKRISEADGYTILFGKFVDGSEILDEVLVSVFKNPQSYTGEDSVEISFHGSPYIIQRALELLIQKRSTNCRSGENFTQTGIFERKMDLSQAEAVADLIASEARAVTI